MTDQSHSELKECPFCGKKELNFISIHSVGDNKYVTHPYIACVNKDCLVRPCVGDFRKYADEEELIEMCNRRLAQEYLFELK